MALTKYTPSNNAQGQLLAGISAGATTLILGSGQGGRFPSVYPYLLEIKQNDTVAPYAVLKREIVRVTNRVSDTFTIVRSSGTCLPDDSSNTPGTTAFSFSTGDTVTLTVTAETIKDIQDEIITKLAIAGGLRTSFGTDKHVRVSRTTGSEEIKSVSTVSTISTTDKFRIEDWSTGDYKDFPYSVIRSDMANSSQKQVTSIAGEALTANDFVYEETLHTFIANYATSVPSSGQSMGDTAANTKLSLKFIWSWTSASSLKMWLNKAGAPADNVIVRIETDSSGNPSGTLVHANATSTISWASISTWTSEVTVTFAWSFTCSANTPYHVVISRSWINDWVNYYQIPIYLETVRGFLMNKYNASWGSPITTQTYWMIFVWAVSTVICKTNAVNKNQTGYIWYVQSSASIGASVTVTTEKSSNTFSGLTTWLNYYLSDTPGAVSATPGTNVRMVWVATATTTIDIIKPDINITLYENRAAQYTTIYNTAGKFHFRALFPCTLLVSTTGTSVISVNQVAKTSWVAFDMLPWDLLYAYGGTALSVGILNKVIESGIILT